MSSPITKSGWALGGLSTALILATLSAPIAAAAKVEPTQPEPSHCRVPRQLIGDTAVMPPDPRFDWKKWLDTAPDDADLPCDPDAVFGGTLPAHMIPPWVLDELLRR